MSINIDDQELNNKDRSLMVYIILFEEIEEKEFDEQKQKVINKADRRLHRHKRENRFLWKSSENYGGVIDDTTLMVINKLINVN